MLGYMVEGVGLLGIGLDMGPLSIRKDIFLILIPVTLFCSGYYPLFYRYGNRQGMDMGCYIIIFLLFILVLFLLEVVVVWFKGGQMILIGSMVNGDNLFRAIPLAIKNCYHILGPGLFHFILAILMMVMIAASIMLSLKFYRQREF